MSWYDRIFRYCERGQDASFWAEPVNALSNVAFILAGLLALFQLARSRGLRGSMAEMLLSLLVIVIGIGSFLFHTYATRWASYADTAPIGLFMIAYLGYALRRYLGLHALAILALVAAFIGALKLAGDVPCRPSLLPVTAAAGAPCLNGSTGYIPAFLTLLAVAIVLAAERHAAWRLLAAASLALAASLTFRTLDLELCALTRVAGVPLGTHFLWHLLNALTLYLMLRAAIRHGGPR